MEQNTKEAKRKALKKAMRSIRVKLKRHTTPREEIKVLRAELARLKEDYRALDEESRSSM